jgi:hypothetical protein
MFTNELIVDADDFWSLISFNKVPISPDIPAKNPILVENTKKFGVNTLYNFQNSPLAIIFIL